MSETLKSGRKFRLLAVLAVVALAGWATHDYWGALFANVSVAPKAAPAKAKKPAKGVPVLVAAVGEEQDEVVIEAIGTARALRSVTLFPQAAGEIIAFPVQSGAQVEQDAVLMRLDSRTLALNVRVAETRVKEAESAFARAKKLRENNVRSSANVDDAEIILQRARLEVSQAKEALADRTTRAPFAGIIGIPKVEIGDRVTTATEIITLDDRTTLLVEFEIAERYLSRLSVGMPLTARTPTFPDRAVAGQIDKIDSRVDPVSRTVLVRAAFLNADDLLRPGMSFFVALPLPGPTLASVPELALQWQDGKSFVWRIRDGAAERVDVSSRRRLNSKVLIDGDIQPGDIVVIEGVQRLRPGRAVEISGSQNP